PPPARRRRRRASRGGGALRASCVGLGLGGLGLGGVGLGGLLAGGLGLGGLGSRGFGALSLFGGALLGSQARLLLLEALGFVLGLELAGAGLLFGELLGGLGAGFLELALDAGGGGGSPSRAFGGVALEFEHEDEEGERHGGAAAEHEVAAEATPGRCGRLGGVGVGPGLARALAEHDGLCRRDEGRGGAGAGGRGFGARRLARGGARGARERGVGAGADEDLRGERER